LGKVERGLAKDSCLRVRERHTCERPLKSKCRPIGGSRQRRRNGMHETNSTPAHIVARAQPKTSDCLYKHTLSLVELSQIVMIKKEAGGLE